jgi:hypothetical protein
VSRHFGIFPGSIVANPTRKFNDPVMHFDPNRSGNNILFTIKLSKDLLPYLHIVFH